MKPPTVRTAIGAFLAMLVWVIVKGLCALLVIIATPCLYLGNALTPRRPRCPHR